MNWLLLLAETRGIVSRANRPRPGDWQFGWDRVGLIAGFSIAIVMSIWLVTRLVQARRRRNSDSPWLLFQELCAAHGLNRRERLLLTRLAQHRQLEQPAALFVDAMCWSAEALGPAWTRSLPDLERLRRRLFSPR